MLGVHSSHFRHRDACVADLANGSHRQAVSIARSRCRSKSILETRRKVLNIPVVFNSPNFPEREGHALQDSGFVMKLTWIFDGIGDNQSQSARTRYAVRKQFRESVDHDETPVSDFSGGC